MDEQRDPAADFQAVMQGAVEAMGRAAQAYVEQLRPVFEALGRLAQDPVVRAYVEGRERGEIPPPEPRRPCHCFCPYSHPDDKGICDGQGVTTRRFAARLTGPVDVPLCAPCAVAQGVAELQPR